MTRSRTITTIAAVAAVALGIGLTAASAQGGRGFGGPGRGGPFGRGGMMGGGPFMLGQLDLTEQQRQQVAAIHEQNREAGQAAAEKLRAAHDAQRAAVTAVPFDENAIRTTTAALAAAMTEQALLQARIHAQVYEILTPEQRAKAEELRGKRRELMDERRPRGPRGRGMRFGPRA
jgi:protein CpxP